jgi:hypothetical protein
MDTISRTILLLIIALVAHLAEEVRAGFRKRFPLGEMPVPLFAGINVSIYTFCALTLRLSLRRNPLAVPFAWVFAAFMLMNGLGHLGIMAVKRGYFPGGLTAPVLSLLSVYLMWQLDQKK